MNSDPARPGRRPRRRGPAGRLAVALVLAVLPVLAVCTERHAVAPVATAPSPLELGPRLRLRVSGNLEGRLEPCGCASGQLGGLARRAFHLQHDRNYDLLIEGGNAVKDGSPLDIAKLETALSILDLAGYAVLGLGQRDLMVPHEELATYLALFRMTPLASDLVEKAPPPDPAAAFPSKTFRDHDGAPGARIASLVLHLPEGPARERFTLLAPEAAWQKAMADCPGERLRLLLVHGSGDEVRAAARYTPRPDLVIGVSEAFNEPPHQPEEVAGVPVVFTGIRGRMLLDLTLARREADGSPHLTRYHVVELAGSKSAPGAAEDREARAMILAHRDQVREQGLRERMAERLPTAAGRTYVGTEVCANCHDDAHAVWKKSKHAVAWETLEKAEKGTRYGWPVTAYPDCVGCHVVGYGYQSGFVNPTKTPLLKDVGCEECHGPGSHHVHAYENDRPKAEGLMGKVSPDVCLRCHDFEQSPTFVYGERWKVIEHR